MASMAAEEEKLRRLDEEAMAVHNELDSLTHRHEAAFSEKPNWLSSRLPMKRMKASSKSGRRLGKPRRKNCGSRRNKRKPSWQRLKRPWP